MISKMVSNRGFTLAELAIVVAITGLLIGGVLKGQEMINNAQITTTITQVESYRFAHKTFRDRYKAMPGDMLRARERLPNCSASTYCYNGNGDGTLGTVTTNYSRNDQSKLTSMPAVETSMYWKHLALADLISGVNATSNVTQPAWGQTHPAAKTGGGFHVLTANETGDNQASGDYYILRKPVTGDPHPTQPGITALTPGQAAQIDRKIDDGNARQGSIRADDAAGWCSNATTGVYNERGTNRDCLMIWEIK